MVSITAKHNKGISKYQASVAVTTQRPLPLGSDSVVLNDWNSWAEFRYCWHLAEDLWSFAHRVVVGFEWGIRIFYYIRVFHANRSWWLQLHMNIVMVVIMVMMVFLFRGWFSFFQSTLKRRLLAGSHRTAIGWNKHRTSISSRAEIRCCAWPLAC